ncbi:MAG: N,N-dimethylformamidase beta subunit family domain-containing protein, partial [Ramlibacter sp.]
MAKGNLKLRIGAFWLLLERGTRWLDFRSAIPSKALVCFAVVLAACGGGGGGGDAHQATSGTPGSASGAGLSPGPAPVTQGAGTTAPAPGSTGTPSASADATNCTASTSGGTAVQNVIQQENAKPGDGDWGLTALSDTPTVEGYASATSVNRGDTIRFFVSSDAPKYRMTIYRMGWYGGAGARKMMSVTLNGSKQPMPAPDPRTGLIEANWPESYRLTIPSSSDKTDWATGV